MNFRNGSFQFIGNITLNIVYYKMADTAFIMALYKHVAT